MWGYKWFYTSGEKWFYQERRQKQRAFTIDTNSKGIFWPERVCMGVWYNQGHESTGSIKTGQQEIHCRWEIKNTQWFDVLSYPAAWRNPQKENRVTSSLNVSRDRTEFATFEIQHPRTLCLSWMSAVFSPHWPQLLPSPHWAHTLAIYSYSWKLP